MKPLRSLTHAIAIASLLSAASFAVQAKDILINGTALEDDVVTKVTAIDMATRVVTVDGPDGKPVDIQVSDKAKALGNLKVGDQVNVHVTRAVATVLNTEVGGEPGASKEAGVIRATKDNPNPGGEAFRQIKITSKITAIDLNKHEVTLLPPEGPRKTVIVEDPELQARMKNLKVGQTVDLVYTDVLTITTQTPQ
ncbi:hypothetical protein DM813_07365 [Pseudomonas alkylphenolica]|uniref:DUF5666 domain-containing protein n=1 Tax=Pseudomonas alkylphenolica TaxID=237609 RepID=A0A443ZX33_9PSED|nr:hypothetical protein [Pseudomonas alkylphenolica]RWU25528.1 hypothetical protein DM813_07365 [Pseudomonas alkylphenolica]